MDGIWWSQRQGQIALVSTVKEVVYPNGRDLRKWSPPKKVVYPKQVVPVSQFLKVSLANVWRYNEIVA